MAPRFDVIGIVTADLPRSLAFYRRLGVDVPEGVDDAPHVEADLPGGMRLAWDPVATVVSFHPDWTPGQGSIGLAFRCDDPAEVDATFASLVAAGAPAELEPFDAPWGQRYATVADPDGNGVDLYAPLPGSPG